MTAETLIERRGIYHGWKVVAALFLTGMMVYGCGLYSFTLFVTPLTEEFGWSRAATSGLVSIYWLAAPLTRPVIRMGQNSLYIFCLGIFLSYLGHLYLVEFHSGTAAHLGVSAAGVAIMAAVAGTMDWVRRAEARRRTVAG